MKYFEEFKKVKNLKKKDWITMLIVIASMLILYFLFAEGGIWQTYLFKELLPRLFWDF